MVLHFEPRTVRTAAAPATATSTATAEHANGSAAIRIAQEDLGQDGTAAVAAGAIVGAANLSALPAGARRLGAAALAELEACLAGELILPGMERYDGARRVWNASVDRFPSVIVRAADAADVARAVAFARDNDLPLAIRSGGHSMAGHGTVQDGVVLDLSGMKEMHVDPINRVAWVQPGVTWGEYAARAGEHGLVTPSGDSGSVGVGGLTLGGGIGFMARKYGLAVDNLLSVELVTADGRFITASEREHPDLFWALRGGGGNFGVATGFEFRLHEVPSIYGGALFYEATPEILKAYARVAAAAPDELTTIANVMMAPPLPFIPAERHGTLVFAMLVCYAGDAASGKEAVAALRALDPNAAPFADVLGPMPYPALFNLTAAGAASHPHSTRHGFLRSLEDGVAETIVEYARRMTSPLGMVQLRVLGGAMARVPAEATAFAHRDKELLVAVINAWQHGDDATRHVAWTQFFWDALEGRTSGAYSNFLEDEGRARIAAAYPAATYAQLAAVKRAYDPANVFKLNQNVRPAGAVAQATPAGAATATTGITPQRAA